MEANHCHMKQQTSNAYHQATEEREGQRGRQSMMKGIANAKDSVEKERYIRKGVREFADVAENETLAFWEPVISKRRTYRETA
jgi:hypothetical protein